MSVKMYNRKTFEAHYELKASYSPHGKWHFVLNADMFDKNNMMAKSYYRHPNGHNCILLNLSVSACKHFQILDEGVWVVISYNGQRFEEVIPFEAFLANVGLVGIPGSPEGTRVELPMLMLYDLEQTQPAAPKSEESAAKKRPVLKIVK